MERLRAIVKSYPVKDRRGKVLAMTKRYVVALYRPRRCKAGHYVWVKVKEVSRPLTGSELAEYEPNMPIGSLHGYRLSTDEAIRAMAEEEDRA